MAKKSFKDNPAMQFISAPEAEQPPDRPTPETLPRLTGKPPKGYKANPLYVEVKSRRVQLVLQPSLYERVKKRAEGAGLSFNEFVHQILDDATREG